MLNRKSLSGIIVLIIFITSFDLRSQERNLFERLRDNASLGGSVYTSVFRNTLKPGNQFYTGFQLNLISHPFEIESFFVRYDLGVSYDYSSNNYSVRVPVGLILAPVAALYLSQAGLAVLGLYLALIPNSLGYEFFISKKWQSNLAFDVLNIMYHRDGIDLYSGISAGTSYHINKTTNFITNLSFQKNWGFNPNFDGTCYQLCATLEHDF